MKISIPWFEPEVGDREKELVYKVFDSGYINDGEVTRAFESKVAELIGVKHCVAVTSGTVAISLALMGMGIGFGDEVIVPDLTFIATANAVAMTGAEVKLVDIEPDRFGIDINKLKEAIGKRTKAIVPVDVNGRGANYDDLMPFAKEKGLFVICDAAEGLGSKYKDCYLGSFGDAGCFSFSANKTVSTGQGGMIATNNRDLYYRLRELKDQGRRYQGTGGDDIHPVMGFNFKLTNYQAAVGLAQMERLTGRLETARKRDLRYRECLDGCPGMIFPPLSAGDGEVLQWTDILVEDRVKLSAALDRGGLGHRAFWHPLHRQAPYAAEEKCYSNSIAVSEKGMWLPSSFNISKEQIEGVSGTIRKALSE